MKSVIRCACMMALVVLAFTACKKNEQNEPKKTTFTASTPQLEYEGDDRVYFALDDPSRRIVFEPGDMCMLFNINESEPWRSNCATYEAIQEGNDVEFRNCGLGEVALERQDAFYVVYPGGPGCTQTELSSGENKSRFYVSPNQEYSQGIINIGLPNMYMFGKVDDVDELGDVHFQFHYLSGILGIKAYEAAQRRLTEIKIVDNYFDLSGWVEVILPQFDWVEFVSMYNRYDLDNPDYLEELEAYKQRIGYQMYDASNTFTLNIPDGVQLGNSNASTTCFYITLRPLALLLGGHVVFTFDDGSQKEVEIPAHALTSAPGVIKRVTINLDGF
ncbi:MAG: hypothetical protein J6T22_08280 [Bacteroidales bacterium]|nr:hypothetical protein [Bacteroidales bacterium]